jgi:hypothetical protein
MAIALAAAVIGCGGGDDSSDSSSAALTKAEFIKEADKVCKDGEEALEAEGEEFAEDNDVDIENPTQEQQEEVVVDVVGPALHKQGEEIAELGAPEGEEETVEAIVEALETGSDELESDPGAFIEGKENPLAEASKLARDYGLTECGEE